MSKTLLQLMLESNVVWHKGIFYAVQSWPAKDIPTVEDPGVCLYQECPSLAPDGTWVSSNGPSGFSSVGGWAEDRLTKVISKEEYLASGGWMDYDGSGSPAQAGIIKAGTLVEVVWDDGSTTQFRDGDGSGVAWIGGSPRILRYRILVGETPINEPCPAATEQASKEAESTCTILMMSGEVHYGARVTYQSDQTVVWECDGVEHASKAEYVKIGPPRDALASSVLHRLCRVSVAPSIMLELMNKMGWK